MTRGSGEPGPGVAQRPARPVTAAIVLAADPPPGGRPVELVRLGGPTVLERAVRALTVAGIPRVLVAAGGRTRVAAPGAETYVPGTALPAGRYLLVAGSALFDAETVRSLAEHTADDVRCTDADLAVVDAATATAAASGGASLDAALAGRQMTLTPAAGFATTLTGPADVRRVRRALWHRYGPKPTDGLVSRYLNRPLSRPVTLLLTGTRLAPDVLTVASFLVAVAGAAVIGFGGRWWTMLLGGLLVQAGNALDGVDGEVARIGLRVSRRGALLDTTLDRYADLAVLAGLALAAGGGPVAWIWAFAAAAASLLISYINALAPRAPQRLLRRDVRLLVCAVAAAVSVPLWGLVAVAVLGNLDALRVFGQVIRRAPGAR